MDMYTKHFCFNFFDMFKYIKHAFQIKGANAPESKKASPIHFLLFSYTFVTIIIPSNENSSRLSFLKALDPLFFICVY
jgi:hypothetical protein